jgi:hypothetical protein
MMNNMGKESCTGGCLGGWSPVYTHTSLGAIRTQGASIVNYA